MTDASKPVWQAHSIEAEQGLLGALLMNNKAVPLVSDTLREDHFFEPLHSQIYQIILNLTNAGKHASPTSIRSFMPDIEIGPGMTTVKYLARLAVEATTVANARDYAEIIRDLHYRRTMRAIGQELAIEMPGDTMKLAADSIEALDTIIAEGSQFRSRQVTMAEAVVAAVDATAKAYENDGAIQGLPWGLADLDQRTDGLHAGDLIVLAGRPGMGKTAMACSVIRNLVAAGHAGTIFSLEMESTPLAHRFIADEMHDSSPLHYTKMRNGRLDEAVFGRFTKAAETVGRWPLMIDPQAGMTFSQIAARARRAKRSRDIKWLAIDHLHLMKTPGQNKVIELGEITSGLKSLAKELGIPVLLLSQMNRQVESREDKRPTLSDLRFSGDIEQDADVIVMLYREAYYVQKLEPDARPDSEEYASWQVKMQRCFNRLDAIVEKQRQGPTGTVKLYCNIGCNAVRSITADPDGGNK